MSADPYLIQLQPGDNEIVRDIVIQRWLTYIGAAILENSGGNTGAQGVVEIDFGNPPGSLQAEAVITGQASLKNTSNIRCHMDSSTTSDWNEAGLNVVDASGVSYRATNVVPDTGAGGSFTATVTTSGLRLTGKIPVAWSWQ